MGLLGSMPKVYQIVNRLPLFHTKVKLLFDTCKGLLYKIGIFALLDYIDMQKIIVVYNKTTDEMVLFKEKTTLAEFLGVSLRSIYNFISKGKYETDIFKVYFDTIQPKKSKRGGKK
jgi:hypothetical protein